MNLIKTDKERLTPDEIEAYITDHEVRNVPRFNMLWEYYQGKNVKILSTRKADEGNPDNKTPVSYARKIITTFTGYGYRPKYITYDVEDSDEIANAEDYEKMLDANFKLNNEPIKTSRNGRNTAIFGEAYELVFVDRMIDGTLNPKAVPKFINLDPREIILIYDYSSEPQKKIAIRYYKVGAGKWKVEVYYPDRVELYDRVKKETGAQNGEFILKPNPETPTFPNFFGEVPIVPYYFGDDGLGIIEPVLPLIDDYDALISGSFIEFDRFANAYLRLVKMGMGGKTPAPSDGAPDRQAWAWLQRLRKSRVFEQLQDKDDVTFLTKDIPTAFVTWMEGILRKQIHTQSSVPDFAEFTDISGAAIERLMFDFENVVSSAEADFDVGLYERIRLINTIWTGTNAGTVLDPGAVTISHKRNVAFDLKGLADVALTMKQAGFSREAVVGIMPESVIPDDSLEIERQLEELNQGMPSVDNAMPPDPNSSTNQDPGTSLDNMNPEDMPADGGPGSAGAA